jgi:hypothetical protein
MADFYDEGNEHLGYETAGNSFISWVINNCYRSFRTFPCEKSGQLSAWQPESDFRLEKGLDPFGTASRLALGPTEPPI